MAISIKLFLRFIFLVELISKGVSRKYNLEEDGFKLYGEDMGSILEKFRKSSVYSDILATENEVLYQHYTDLTMVLYEYLESEVEDMLDSDNITSVKKPEQGRSCSMKGSQASRNNVARKPLRFHATKTRLRTTEDDRNEIAELEKFYKGKMCLPADYVNKMISKGFNILKKGIRSFISTIGDADISDEDFGKTMTKFQVDHTIKGSLHDGDVHSTPALYRYRKKIL